MPIHNTHCPAYYHTAQERQEAAMIRIATTVTRAHPVWALWWWGVAWYSHTVCTVIVTTIVVSCGVFLVNS